MEQNDRLLEHYNYIRRLAESRCSSIEDAEDLISETFLEAYACISRGGCIEHPKTWLSNTLMHKLGSLLRKKYSSPTTVGLDAAEDIPDDSDADFDSFEEAEKVRREINYLSRLTREVIIYYYYNNKSIADIARQLRIPEGTVKSRLSAGREKIKKGFTDMNETKNNLPGRLYVWTDGSQGPKNEPVCYIEGDLIVQNLLALAYDKPLTIPELAAAIGIPTVYIEPIVNKLVNAELMVKTDGGKVYTDFLILHPSDYTGRFKAQKEFTEKRFDRFWNIVSDGVNKLRSLDFVKKLNERQQTKLERYLVLNSLQQFELRLCSGSINKPPKRRDGGTWTACGSYTPAGYIESEEEKAEREYQIWGGHRTDGGACDYNGAKFMQLVEFDTTLWDNPCRYHVCGFDLYFKEIRKLLWCIYKKLPIETSGIPSALLEKIPDLIAKTGLLVREDGELKVDIPVVTPEEYRRVKEITAECFEQLKSELGSEYTEYLRGNMVDIPKHLKGIPDGYRYRPLTENIVMLIVMEAYEKGLHLAGVDYCCPPVVFICE